MILVRIVLLSEIIIHFQAWILGYCQEIPVVCVSYAPADALSCVRGI